MPNTGNNLIVFPKYFSIVLALAGDSTITRYLYAIQRVAPFGFCVSSIIYIKM